MFNLFPKFGSFGDSTSKCDWLSNTGYTIDGKFYTPAELMNEFIKLKDENEKLYKGPSYIQDQQDMIDELLKDKKNLEDILKSIEEDGTVEHNNAIKLRQENVELKGELETIELEFNLVLEINDDINKKLISLNHLKTENVELIERIKKLEEDIPKYKNGNSDWCRLYESASKDRADLENKLDFEQKKYQILDHNYQGCTKYRDEYKHQLNAANREVEALKSKLRDYQDMYAESFSYNDMNKLQKEIDILKGWKREMLIVTEWWEEISEYIRNHEEVQLGTYISAQVLDFLKQRDSFKKDNEKLNLQIVALHKIIEGAKKTIDEQKHPMYPIHWGGITPIWGGYDKNIKEFVESELNNEDPVEGISELLQKAKDLTEGVEVDLDKSLDEQSNESIKKFVESISCPEDDDNEICYICDKCGYKIVDDIFYNGGCGFCKEGKMVEYKKWCTTKVAMQDAVQAKHREVYGVENNFSEEKVPHVMVEYVWIPVDQTEFIGISEDLFGKDVYEFEYNGKVYASHVILKYKN